MAAALLLLLALIRCDCQAPPPPPGLATDAGATERAPAVAVPKTPPRPRPITAHMKPQPRGEFTLSDRDRASWLEAFRMQVSARSPQLATCFEGSDHPGAFRWTASLNLSTGEIADQALEPTSASAALDSRQSQCVQNWLSVPSYRPIDTRDAGIERVSLVIEF